MLADKRLPNRHDLDKVSPDNPVALRSGRYLIDNTVALQRVGYTKDTVDPPGSKIWRDANGEPTGFLLKTAYRPVLEHTPKLTRKEQLEGIHRQSDESTAGA